MSALIWMSLPLASFRMITALKDAIVIDEASTAPPAAMPEVSLVTAVTAANKGMPVVRFEELDAPQEMLAVSAMTVVSAEASVVTEVTAEAKGMLAIEDKVADALQGAPTIEFRAPEYGAGSTSCAQLSLALSNPTSSDIR